MNNLNILKDASEIIHYHNPNIPFYIGEDYLSNYYNMTALCHWHEDIEYIHPKVGHMTYYINGEKLTIQENDAVIINSKQMHYCCSEDKTDCRFLCILFRSSLLFGNQELYRIYVTPITTLSQLPYYYLKASDSREAYIIQLLDDIQSTFCQKPSGYELDLISKLLMVWKYWYQLLQPELSDQSASINQNLEQQKNMIEYIYENYTGKITLQDIASAGNVCRSKCCQIFKRYLNKTPIEFLNAYRLKVSMNLLIDTDLSITEIAFNCGFHSPSYYTELFTRYKGCSPGSFRLQQNVPCIF